MNILESNLKILTRDIELLNVDSLPSEIYRFFDSPEARDNFLTGNIWFAGPNKNRFFCKTASDPTEYKTPNGAWLFEYALSFTRRTNWPNLDYGIIITNPLGFINALVSTIRNNQLTHKITWLNFNDLKHYKYTSQQPSINAIRKYPTTPGEIVTLGVEGVMARDLKYVNKEFSSTNPMEDAENARNKNNKFAEEKEFRIHLNTTDFREYPGNCLENLVEYIKLQCPEIAKYCNPCK